jgi:hypothetical protein
MQVALTDTLDEFVVETILEMKGDPRASQKALKFKVRWAGYGPQDDTWEPWDFVKNNDQLQLFLYNNPNARIRALVNKDFIPPHLRKDNESEDSDQDT